MSRWGNSVGKMGNITVGFVEMRVAWSTMTLAKWREVDEFRICMRV